jgi:hypothetical protein
MTLRGTRRGHAPWKTPAVRSDDNGNRKASNKLAKVVRMVSAPL